jgi:hypothetical protein
MLPAHGAGKTALPHSSGEPRRLEQANHLCPEQNDIPLNRIIVKDKTAKGNLISKMNIPSKRLIL